MASFHIRQPAKTSYIDELKPLAVVELPPCSQVGVRVIRRVGCFNTKFSGHSEVADEFMVIVEAEDYELTSSLDRTECSSD